MGTRLRSVSFACLLLFLTSASFAQLRISVGFGPPPLPVYEQPLCPGDGYIWTPGYWAWDDDGDDYYWVPGTWVLAPQPGFFWTPPYWGWVGGSFLFYEGYWGPHVGFYGGINYGFGYFGEGFVGGRWDGNRFFYNRSVTNVNVTNVRNVYNTTIVNNNRTVNRVSYNGGNGGVVARPTAEQEGFARERHVPPVAAQTHQVQEARGNPQFRASTNHGKPPVGATERPGEFSGRGAVAAREAGGPYNPPANRRTNQPRSDGGGHPNAIHPNELTPANRPASPNTGNPKLDQKYQRQQEKLQQQQGKERQKLQQQQEKEHQQMTKQNADEARKQQMEQRHQQQTQQLQERHAQQQEHLQQRQAPPSHPQGPPRGR